MSLEQALKENTEALQRLTAILQSGAALPTGTAATTTPPTASGRGRGKGKDTTAADAGNGATGQGTQPDTTTTGQSAQGAAAQGAGEANVNPGPDSIYVHIAAHKSVAEIKAGQVIPSIAGMVKITAAEYETLKAAYTPVPTGTAAGTPAAATPSASTASSTTSAGSGAVTPEQIKAKAQELHGKQGNDGLLAVLKHFGVERVPALTNLAATRGAEIIKHIDGVLNPQAAAEPDNLFG